MKTKIYSNYSEFLNRENRKENGVSKEFAELNPKFEAQNESNASSWNCSRCSRCSGCSDCFDCFDCFDCSGCFDCSRCFDCSDCYDYADAMLAQREKD